MERIYFDNAATTRVAPEVVDAMTPYFGEMYGNPSSLHALGTEAKEALEDARTRLARRINATARELIFTSGGTEANNLAIKGAAYENRAKGKHIITSRIEHSSVLNTLSWLQKQGYEITQLPVDGYGLVRAEDLAGAIRRDTVLVTIGHANNEIGTVQDIRELGRITRENGVLFHTDACQSFTKEAIDARSMDMATINAHKINGPKGVGALYIRAGVRIAPQEHGGPHEYNMRGGTENVPGAVGFAKAAEITTEKEIAHMRGLRDMLIKGIGGTVGSSRLNGHPERRLCNNVNHVFAGIEGESLLLRLDARGLMGSTGSACSSQSLEPSHVLLAIGLKPEDAHGSLRLTVGRYNREDEAKAAVDAVREEVEGLRRISPTWRK